MEWNKTVCSNDMFPMQNIFHYNTLHTWNIHQSPHHFGNFHVLHSASHHESQSIDRVGNHIPDHPNLFNYICWKLLLFVCGHNNALTTLMIWRWVFFLHFTRQLYNWLLYHCKSAVLHSDFRSRVRISPSDYLCQSVENCGFGVFRNKDRDQGDQTARNWSDLTMHSYSLSAVSTYITRAFVGM